MIVEYTTSFDRSFKRLPPDRQNRITFSIAAVIKFFETQQRTPGLGLKHLRKNFWEIRAGLMDRVLFLMKGPIIRFVMAGTHDDVNRFLKR